MLPPITPEARRYAIKELARRSGVSPDFFAQWQVNVATDHTSVSFGPAAAAKVCFIHASAKSLEEAQQTIPVARARPFGDLDAVFSDSDLILPFCASEQDSRAPLYFLHADGTMVCRLDLPLAILYTLSRVEEILCDSRDEHNRFPASASISSRHNFLERPILDEHGLAFQKVLSALLPSWHPKPRSLRYKLTHDIDDIGLPFHPRSAIAHTLKRRNPPATLLDLLSPISSLEPADLRAVRSLAAISESRGLQSAFYWKASQFGPHDSGYDLLHPKVVRILDHLRDRGFELGVHPGYDTFADRQKLAVEVDLARRALGTDNMGGRQHYLRWLPDSWADWEACDLSYDSTLGFADRFGFRCGTAFPYRPWSFACNRELALVEVPLILMDCTPVKYMKLARQEGLQRIADLVRRIACTGGVFTMLWHNTPLLDPEYNGWYQSILDMLSGVRPFNFPANIQDFW